MLSPGAFTASVEGCGFVTQNHPAGLLWHHLSLKRSCVLLYRIRAKSRLTSWSPRTPEGWGEGSFSYGRDESSNLYILWHHSSIGVGSHCSLTKGKSLRPLSAFVNRAWSKASPPPTPSFFLCIWLNWASWIAQVIKNPLAMQETQETWVQSLCQEHLLEEEGTTPFSILARRIPWTEEPGRPQSVGLQRIGHDWAHMHG